MTRDELKGKQTPGEAHYIGERETPDEHGWHVDIAEGRRTVRFEGLSNVEACANASLYAEAHNVANRTGMWPEDLVERVKELEEALRVCEIDYSMLARVAAASFLSQLSEDSHNKAVAIRAILNKKP